MSCFKNRSFVCRRPSGCICTLLFSFAFSASSGVRVSHSDSLGPFQGFQIVDWEKKTCCSWMEESAVADKDCEALQAPDLFVWRSGMDSERRHVTLKTRNTRNTWFVSSKLHSVFPVLKGTSSPWMKHLRPPPSLLVLGRSQGIESPPFQLPTQSGAELSGPLDASPPSEKPFQTTLAPL